MKRSIFISPQSPHAGRDARAPRMHVAQGARFQRSVDRNYGLGVHNPLSPAQGGLRLA
jgi:hypothetical protein